MKRFYAVLLLAVVAGVGFSACSKDDDGGEMPKGKANFSMKIDGKPWQAHLTTLITEDVGEGDYAVTLGGNQIDISDDQNGENHGIVMTLAIPKAKFNNPRGSYPVVGRLESEGGAVSMLYTEVTLQGNANNYISVNPSSPNQPVGTLEITGFEIGEQKILGQQTGELGYTKLSGTFKADLRPVLESGRAVVNITEGKFDLKSGMGIDF